MESDGAAVPAMGRGEEAGVVGTVLMVEDERDIRDVLRRYLERAGHAVLTTGSGLEGLRLLGDGGVDLPRRPESS